MDEKNTNIALAEEEVLTEEVALPADSGYAARPAKTETNLPMRMVKAVVPWKGDKPLEIIRKCVFSVSLVVAVIFTVIIIRNLNSGKENEAMYNRLFEEIGDPATFSGEFTSTPDEVDEVMQQVPGIMEKYIDWYNRNDHMIGWINIPGTRMNYPVTQYRVYNDDGTVSGDNQFYLYRTFERTHSEFGSIYAEWRFPFTPTSRPNNTVLYGHNNGDGSMFASATRYYAYHWANNGSIQHYLDNPLIYFDTLYEEGVYKVFAAMYVHTEENKFDDVFDYFRWRVFPDRDTFYAFIINVMDRSSFHTDVDLEYGDEILTLSTCYFPLGQNVDSRIAVFARRVRPGESIDVNLDLARLNPSPLFFAEYYRQMGGSWGGRNWDTALVRGLCDWLEERGSNEVPRMFVEKRAEVISSRTDDD